KTGGVYADAMPVGGRAAPGEDGYVPAVPDTFVVAAVVFADGTYEGNGRVARTVTAIRAGDKIQLTRIVSLLREAQAAPDAGAPEWLARLKERADALGCVADASALAEVSNQYPEFTDDGRGSARVPAEVAMSVVKKDLVDALAEFEKGEAASPGGIDF